MRDLVAIAAGRLAAASSRALRAGGGTTVPGRVATAIAPGLIYALSSRLDRGVVLVSGTNGKTTTARLLGGILDSAGLVAIHNRAGANLLSGVASALVESSTLLGRPRGDIGLFEVDEATLPAVVEATRPRVLILLNLFRDQLDRYGEIDLVADRWRRALGAMPKGATLVFNADDPLVADVSRGYGGPSLAFGIEESPRRADAGPGPDARASTEGLAGAEGGAPGEEGSVPGADGARVLEGAADARYCYRCGRPYDYSLVLLGHMGHYACARCGTARPYPQVRALRVRLRGADGGSATVAWEGESMEIESALPGLYNVYDATAAVAGALALRISPETIVRGVAATAPAFGRGERVVVGGREAVFLLAKNPAGFNEVLRTVLLAEEAPVVLIAINDLIADGRDISWLWDVDFEQLAGRARTIVVTGIRAEDMALRLKYAGVAAERVTLERDLARAISRTGEAAGEGGRFYVLPTYTAMLDLRGVLARAGIVRGFWRQ